MDRQDPQDPQDLPDQQDKEGPLVNVVSQGLMVLLVKQDPQGLLDHLVHLVHRALLDHVAKQVHLGQVDREEKLDLVVLGVRQGHVVRQGHQGPLELMATEDNQDLLDQVGQQDQQGQQDLVVNRDLGESKGKEVQLASLELLVCNINRDHCNIHQLIVVCFTFVPTIFAMKEHDS